MPIGKDQPLRSTKLKLFLLVLGILSVASYTRGATTYYSQSAAGSANGADCADALALPSSLAVSAGNIYIYCGTGTYAAGTSGAVTLTGGGASGNPAIFRFAHGAIMQAPYWGQNGAIVIAANYITVDGSPTGTPCGYVLAVDTACDGTIQATANGSSGSSGTLANHVPGGKCVWINAGVSNPTVQNVNCQNLFVLVSGNPNNEVTAGFSTNSMCVYADFTASHLTIQNNVCNNTHSFFRWGYEGTSGNSNRIQNNWASNTAEGIWIGAGSSGATIDSGGTISGILNNDFSNLVGDTVALPTCGSGSNHMEFIHLYTNQTGAQIATAGAPFQIGGNYFHGLTGCSFTALVYIECSTACTVGQLYVDIFNNVAVSNDPNSAMTKGAGGNGMFSCEGATCREFNNTFYAVGTSSSENEGIQCEGGSTVTAQNNIFQGNVLAFSGCSTQSNNLGYNLSNPCGPSCSQTGNPLLNTGSTPPYQLTSTSSAAYQHGLNLFGTITALNSDALGVLRPSIGSWDVGAFEFTSGGGGTVATPTFSPAAGSYASTQNVIISTSTGGATICYTTDGTTPTANGAGTCTHGTTYSAAVSVSFSLTLEAIGSKSGFSDSSVGSAAYVIGSVSLAPASNNFGSVIVGIPSSAVIFTLSNTTGVTVTSIVVTFIGANGSDFTRSGGTCGTSLVTGSSCTIGVVFTPGATGSRLGTLSVADSDPSSPQQASLSGTGINGTVTISPTSQNFGSALVGIGSSPVTFTLTNTNAFSVTGISVSFVTENTADFLLTGGTCGSSLPGVDSCTIIVTFTPTAAGARATALNVADSASSSPQQSILTGTGISNIPAPATGMFAELQRVFRVLNPDAASRTR
jgi:hypothetical protein